MACERPAIDEEQVVDVLEDPDHDDGHQAYKRIGRRTILVYYAESPDEIEVQGVSATTGRLAP